jgi:APA family basic amino acid/polyamine antiporter
VRKLSTLDATFIGLAAMLGAGVFVVFGPAFELAGSWLIPAVLLAGLVAYLNAASISQLAAKVERSGGAYAYGRHYLGNGWGALAGLSFLIGKIGSAAAIALTFASYLTPGYEIATAIGSAILMMSINLAGINRTAFGSKVLAAITLSFLAILILASLLAPAVEPAGNTPAPLDFLGAVALLFFAFAGYARVATLGSEVADSGRNVPRAIGISLAIVLAIYLALGYLLPSRLGGSLGGVTPLADLAAVSLPGLPASSIAPFVAVAALGSLLALLAGMSRTAAEMASDSELPRVFATKLRNGAPWVAEVVITSLVLLLILSGGVVFTIGLSSFAILLYYAIANLAALRQPRSETSRAKFWNLAGLVLCLAVALSVPLSSLLLGASVISVAMFLRWGLNTLR